MRRNGAGFGATVEPPGESTMTRLFSPALAARGTAWSANEGNTWNSLTGVTGFWAVAFANERTGWLVGTEGRIFKVTFGK